MEDAKDLSSRLRKIADERDAMQSRIAQLKATVKKLQRKGEAIPEEILALIEEADLVQKPKWPRAPSDTGMHQETQAEPECRQGPEVLDGDPGL